MYKLYYAPGTASTAIHWMLIELKVPFELVLVDFETRAQKSAAYLAINPSGHVPTLVVDGVPYFECAALLMLLADRHPEAGLQPPLICHGCSISPIRFSPRSAIGSIPTKWLGGKTPKPRWRMPGRR
jgi:hypothetical protein